MFVFLMAIRVKILILLTLLVLFALNFRLSFAVDCDALSGDAERQCEALEKKAKVYEDLIKLKNKQQDTLAQQMEFINQEQEKNKNELVLTQQQLEEVNQRIGTLEEDINEKETSAKAQKKILSNLIQSYYEYDQQGVMEIVILDKDFSDLVNQADYIEQSGTKITDVLGQIQSAKQALVDDVNELKEKKEESEKLQEELSDKKSNLQYSENQKQSLLIQTQGEEAKYKDLLANVEQQQKELFNFSGASNVDEVSRSVNDYPRPKTSLASTSWYFSQKDSRWGNMRIGNSNSLMKDYGCAVTCVSMVFRKQGSSIDPGKMAKQKIFYYDLIKWPSSWSPGIELSSSISHGNIKWSDIDDQIKKGNPVIVYIRKTNGRGGHYVVVTGKDSKDYIVHDPYFGANLYLGTSRALVGKIGADSGTQVDQMIIYN